MKPDEIAFNNFPGAVSKREFEAVLNLCKKQYKSVKVMLDRREQFLEDTKNKFDAAQEEGMPDQIKKNLNRIVDALVRKADKELFTLANDEVKDIYDITEFLIRFTSEEDNYEHLDISFLDEHKNDK